MKSTILKKQEDTTGSEEKIKKREIRRFYKERRNAMSSGQVAVLSAQICKNILRSRLFESAGFLYAYYPLGNEADIRLVIWEAWRQGKRVAFPKVFGNEMKYFEITGFDQLSAGTFGVMEPCEDKPVDWRFRDNNLVLTPGVAFDRCGNRMGFGKGYYDRYFSGKHDCMMMGVAYELQVAERIPTGDLDVSLAWLVTEACLAEV